MSQMVGQGETSDVALVLKDLDSSLGSSSKCGEVGTQDERKK